MNNAEVLMPQAEPSRRLEHLAGQLHTLAFDVAEPARTTGEAERRIAEGERIAAAVRSVFRGR